MKNISLKNIIILAALVVCNISYAAQTEAKIEPKGSYNYMSMAKKAGLVAAGCGALYLSYRQARFAGYGMFRDFDKLFKGLYDSEDFKYTFIRSGVATLVWLKTYDILQSVYNSFQPEAVQDSEDTQIE